MYTWLSVIMLTLLTAEISAMDAFITRFKYKYLRQLPNSPLTHKCLLCKKGLFFKGDTQTACDFLEGKLKKIAITGGTRSAGRNTDIFGMMQLIEDGHNRDAVRQILSNESETVREEELIKLDTLADQLADDYDMNEKIH